LIESSAPRNLRDAPDAALRDFILRDINA